METEERWQMIEAERLSLADLLESLSPDQWEAPSLCTEWRVRDVAAHVAMTPAGLGWWPILSGVAKARGDLWAFGRDVAREHADARSTTSSPSCGVTRPRATCRP